MERASAAASVVLPTPGEEEQRGAPRVPHVVSGAGRDHGEAAGTGPAFVVPYCYNRLPLDDVDDLVGLVRLGRPGVLARGDRHDGGLAPLRLLEDAEELPAVRVDVHDIHG
jgi:hypothetical protein